MLTAETLAQRDGLTPATLGGRLNLTTTAEKLDELLEESRAAVVTLVTARALDVTAVSIPTATLRRAVLDVAGDIVAAEQAPAGMRSYLDPAGAVVRVGLDTSRRARVTLAAHLIVGAS